jgi:CO/xanthine dehydrogenase FAD-binding subunit
VAHSVSNALAGLPIPVPDASVLDDAIRHDLTPQDSPGLRGETKRRMATVITRRVLDNLTHWRPT